MQQVWNLCRELSNKAITVNDDKIEWVTERCVMCLRCLHKCPQFAIQYKNMTRKHGQYINPHIKTLD